MLQSLKKFFSHLGPGLITGAADDDPSGILTYLQTGAALGIASLWTALFTLPLMYAIQEMCGRIGFVSDKGLMRLVKEHHTKTFAYFLALISIIVITINIGADLYGVSVVLEELVHLTRFFWLPLLAIIILAGTIFLSYHEFAKFLKWLTLTLLFFVVSIFYLHVDWVYMIRATFVPSFSFSKTSVVLIAAVFGTTISPYLFFWQASEEAEERRLDSSPGTHPLRVTKRRLHLLRVDTFWGMFASNFIMWFIIAGAARVAVINHETSIASFADASSVLRPLLGNFAFVIFSLAIIGTGLLAIPVLAGSIGYIMAEAFGWEEGINKTFKKAPGFYWAIIIATLLGVAIGFLKIDPIQMLIYTAVFFTLITPPLIYAIIRLANNPKVVGTKTNSLLSNIFGWLTFIVMTAIAIVYLLSFWK